MISYKPLMKLLIDLDMNKTDLGEKVGISSSTLAKFGNSDYVSLEIIERICRTLNCQPGDIVEYIPDNDQ